MKLRSENTADPWLALALILLGVLFRLAPHPDNFTPVMAIAFFSGVVLPPSLALTVPLLVMMASDLWMGLHSLFLLVWGTFLAVVFLGVWAKNSGALKTVAAALSGSILFFVVTNLGVFFVDNMYPKDWQGLVQCFTMALPFFRNSLAGDLFYTCTFFALFLAAQWMRQPKKIS